MISKRQARESDLPQLLRLEQSWPAASRAGADKFLARMRKFPQGFLLAVATGAHGHEEIVASMSSMPLHYDPAQVGAMQNWDAVTHGGYLPEPDLASCNALYIVAGVTDRRLGSAALVQAGFLAQAALAGRMGLRYVIAGAVIPGYRRYIQRHGELPAHDYCRTRRGSRLVDPLLAMYESVGFHLPDASHVLADYYPDEDSRNYAALVVRDLQREPMPDASRDMADEFLELAARAAGNGIGKAEANPD